MEFVKKMLPIVLAVLVALTIHTFLVQETIEGNVIKKKIGLKKKGA
jgi:hypothetical protein